MASISSSASASRPLRKARRARIAAVLALFLILAGTRILPAQEGGAAVVERIVVEVDGQVGDPGLFDLIPIRPGDPFSPRLVDQAVKQIFATGLFADVRVSREGGDRIAVRFRGTKASPARLAASLTSLRPGGFLQEDRIAEAVLEVKAGLREEGYFDAVVVCDVRRKAGSTADLVFEAKDWRSFRIGGLEVEWKAEIPERTVLKRLKSKVGDVYVPGRLAADLAALSEGLGRLGYPRAEVVLVGEVFADTSRTVDLRIDIVPHEKITVVIGGAKVPARLVAPIWEERVFEQWGLDEGEVRILNHLRRKGYLFASVESRVEAAGA
ncbi:MAG: bamA, partial [Candidatus Aminicenantes bacterium]|nr:bamA [Candidatus Aminicenantes bacterium]